MDIKEIFKLQGENQPTIYDHYGIKAEEYRAVRADMLRAMLTDEQHSDTLNKYFKELDEHGRMRVWAFADALAMFEILQSKGRPQ
jgi:hypothetical protein